MVSKCYIAFIVLCMSICCFKEVCCSNRNGGSSGNRRSFSRSQTFASRAPPAPETTAADGGGQESARANALFGRSVTFSPQMSTIQESGDVEDRQWIIIIIIIIMFEWILHNIFQIFKGRRTWSDRSIRWRNASNWLRSNNAWTFTITLQSTSTTTVVSPKCPII